MTSERRIFLESDGQFFQLFSFSQHKDGSIYCASPDFNDAKWIGVSANGQTGRVEMVESVGPGKLSLHGSGMTAVRAHDNPKGHQLIVKGNHLRKDFDLGVRHLFTAFTRRPHYLPERSPAFNRSSDYAMHANEELRPFILFFLAVPLVVTQVEIDVLFPQEVLGDVPGDILGVQSFELRFHRIVWYAYRTKHLSWPRDSYFCYGDGYSIPLFVGAGVESLNIDFGPVHYSKSGTTLRIVRPMILGRGSPDGTV